MSQNRKAEAVIYILINTKTLKSTLFILEI